MLGGVTMNGETLYTQAIEEQQRLEDSIANMQYPDLMIKG
jgi:hypothetical protein